jgi:hypothetical protein
MIREKKRDTKVKVKGWWCIVFAVYRRARRSMEDEKERMAKITNALAYGNS